MCNQGSILNASTCRHSLLKEKLVYKYWSKVMQYVMQDTLQFSLIVLHLLERSFNSELRLR